MKFAILFAVIPYVAAATFVVGLIGRFLLLGKRWPAQPVWSRASQRRKPGHRALAGAVIILVTLAHLAVLLAPGAVLAWNAVAWRLYALEGAAFAVGLLALVLGARALRRCFGNRAPSAAAEITDVVFLALLLTGIVSGLGLAAFYRWGSSWAAVTLTPYVASLTHARPQTEFLSEMPFLVQLHVFTAFAALALFPFSSVALAAMMATRRALTPPGEQPQSGSRWRILGDRRRRA
ncbi:respiratory nitrate reductase subunit gamma [Pendulispora albinea]|uniref:Respiratory nitrate reductase subunit gamma n=1 Tax=Pendulispora albinea TaxID=2741071 RepID=A0ABZ2M1P3_9BACT